MSVHNVLEQLLRSGVSKFDQAQQSGDLGKYATGAAAGSLLTVLLGSGRSRSLGGKALKIGTVAALGTLAWRAYNEWQQRQPQGPAAAAGAPAGNATPRFDALPAPQLELHSRAMLKAMIAAAKSDGHMDERERELVETELTRGQADAATRQWVEAELRRPVDPLDVAAAVTSPQMGAEVYLASTLVVDETTTMERAYLDQLAQALKLAPELRATLDAQARSA
jgi:uncharacterized membrane protein YebE (DUF533 family)